MAHLPGSADQLDIKTVLRFKSVECDVWLRRFNLPEYDNKIEKQECLIRYLCSQSQLADHSSYPTNIDSSTSHSHSFSSSTPITSTSQVTHLTDTKDPTLARRSSLLSSSSSSSRSILPSAAATASSSSSESPLKRRRSMMESLNQPEESSQIHIEWALTKEELQICDRKEQNEPLLMPNAKTDANGFRWQLSFYPKGDDNYADYTAIYLRLSTDSFKERFIHKVRVRFAVECVEKPGSECNGQFEFSEDDRGRGFRFIPVPDPALGDCSICLQSDRELMALRRCGHAFCAKCIFKLMQPTNATCPICRGTLSAASGVCEARYCELPKLTIAADIEVCMVERSLSAPVTLKDARRIFEAENEIKNRLSLVESQLNSIRELLNNNNNNSRSSKKISDNGSSGITVKRGGGVTLDLDVAPSVSSSSSKKKKRKFSDI